MANAVDRRDGTAAAAALSVDDARWHIVSLEQIDRALHGGATVNVVVWPDDAVPVDRLADLREPRLLLLGATVEAVVHADVLEDWVRVPVSDDDVRARLRRLRGLAAREPPRPLLTDDGRLIRDGRWVALTPVEERIIRVLLASYLDAVHDDDLIAAVWPETTLSRSALRPRISRLRRRIQPLGLDVATVRTIGYALRPSQAPRRAT